MRYRPIGMKPTASPFNQVTFGYIPLLTIPTRESNMGNKINTAYANNLTSLKGDWRWLHFYAFSDIPVVEESAVSDTGSLIDGEAQGQSDVEYSHATQETHAIVTSAISAMINRNIGSAIFEPPTEYILHLHFPIGFLCRWETRPSVCLAGRVSYRSINRIDGEGT